MRVSLRDALIAVVSGGPVPRDQLAAGLAEIGHRASREQIDRLVQFDTSFTELGAGLAYLPALAESVGFAVPVTAEDVERGFVRMHPWLDPIGWWLIQQHPALLGADGSPLGTLLTDGVFLDGSDTDVVIGPEGWLNGFEDQWMILRVGNEAVIVEGPVGDQPELDAAVAQHLSDVFQASANVQTYHDVETGRHWQIPTASIADTVCELLVAHPEIVRGVTLAIGPDGFAAAGLAINDRDLAPVDIPPPVVDAARARASLMVRYGVDSELATSIEMLLGAIELFDEAGEAALGDSDEERQVAALLFTGLLQHPDVAKAVAGQFHFRSGHYGGLRFAQKISDLAEVDIGDGWGAVWLKAHCNLATGKIDEAATIIDALPPNADSLPLTVDRALVHIERGELKPAEQQARKAQRIIDKANSTLTGLMFGRWVDELLDVLEPVLAQTPRPSAKRNDPCPCGSGRKYKACHLGAEEWALEHRAPLLWQRMGWFVDAFDPDLPFELAEAFAEGAEAIDIVDQLADSPFILDLALREGGLSDRYRAAAQSTIAADEVLLSQRWDLTGRSVFEVERSGHRAMSLKDLATGERVNVTGLGGDPIRPGEILIGRPLPVGDLHLSFSGFLPLPPGAVKQALGVIATADPFAIAAFLGGLNRPPTLSNTDGHRLELTELTWTLPDGTDFDAVDSALRQAGLEAVTGAQGGNDPDEGSIWNLVRATSNQSNSVIATFSHSESVLTASVNSAERAKEMKELVGVHLPAAEYDRATVTDVETELATLRRGDGNGAGGGGDVLSGQEAMKDPAIRAALEEHILNYEREWLDTPIPALNDVTPRQAVNDPIGREEVIRLLASWPEPDGRPGMSPSRIRQALDL